MKMITKLSGLATWVEEKNIQYNQFINKVTNDYKYTCYTLFLLFSSTLIFAYGRFGLGKFIQAVLYTAIMVFIIWLFLLLFAGVLWLIGNIALELLARAEKKLKIKITEISEDQFNGKV